MVGRAMAKDQSPAQSAATPQQKTTGSCGNQIRFAKAALPKIQITPHHKKMGRDSLANMDRGGPPLSPHLPRAEFDPARSAQ